MKLQKITYSDLNARQQENHNYHKVAAVLADYGYTSIRLSDDWQGADFIAAHINGESFLKIQLKGRLSFSKKYLGKDIYIAFPHNGAWYLYPHDELQRVVFESKPYGASRSWQDRGGYSVGAPGHELLQLLEPYRISGSIA